MAETKTIASYYMVWVVTNAIYLTYPSILIPVS